MKLLIDVSSVLKTGLFVGVDKEFGRVIAHEGKEVQVNGWMYGYDNAVKYILEVMETLKLAPIDLIFVTEKKDAIARRRAIYAGYKLGRESRPAEYKVEIDRAITELTSAFRNVGSQVVTQGGAEADDVLAYLARKLSGEIVILTSDGDMTTLINERVSLWQGNRLTKENKYGPFPCKYTPVYKALVGDGKEYKGAVGFGDGAFLDMLVAFGDGGLAAIEGMMKRRTLGELKDDVADFKPFQKVIDGATHVYQSYACALLHDEWVDTLRVPLAWEAGMVRGKDVVTDIRLRPFAQKVYLCTAATYDHIRECFLQDLDVSPCVGLDIETSTPEESDDWLREGGRDNKVDVLGSKITGLSLTVGRNNNHTIYFPIDHAETDNVTSEQVRDLVGAIPQTTPIIVQNFGGFEAPILYLEWGQALKDNGWHGFLPNVVDSAICASYVNENVPMGLKQGSKMYLDYDQVTYDQVTKATMPEADWNGRGKIVRRHYDEPLPTCYVEAGEGDQGETTDYPTGVWMFEDYHDTPPEATYAPAPYRRSLIDVEYKMCDLTGQEVLNYGADDTICSVALYNHFQVRMDLEKTQDVMLQVEQLPAYVTALAYTHGVRFDFARMRQIEDEDHETYDKMWNQLSAFLIEKGWPGTVTPTYTELTPASVKEIVEIVLGEPLVTRTRTVSKLAVLVGQMAHEEADLLALYIAEGNLPKINDLVASRFAGVPVLETDSPKQMREFLYTLLDLPIRVVNSTTANERQNKPLLARLVSDHKKRWAGHTTLEIPQHMYQAHCTAKGLKWPCDTATVEKELLTTKARTDDTAIDFALAMDVEDKPEVARILKCVQTMKKCATRQKLYYTPYAHLRHWKDNKIHGQAGQCRTTTRRYAPNDPNLGQLAKKGEGAKVRECFPAHKKGAVVVSIDFAGQELRQGAGQSGDENMLACFVGEHKKDMHSLTAAGAMAKKWDKVVLADLIERFGEADDDDYTFFVRLLKHVPSDVIHKMADDLRKTAKNVNFGAQYGAMAAKLAETLIIPVTDAQAFLDAKFAMFPRFEAWKKEVENGIKEVGYVLSPMGARRHLRESILSEEWGVADRAMRQGPSFKIQGGSAEQTKMALGRLWRSGILFRLDMEFYYVVHDELVWSVMPEDALESIRVVHAAMTEPYANLPVPFLGSIAVGPNFGKLIECGDEIIEANILAAIAKSVGEEAACSPA